MDMMAMELTLPKATYQTLAQVAEKEHKTVVELAVEAIETYLDRLAKIDPLLGLFADDPELIDSVVEDAMRSRTVTSLRLSEAIGG